MSPLTEGFCIVCGRKGALFCSKECDDAQKASEENPYENFPVFNAANGRPKNQAARLIVEERQIDSELSNLKANEYSYAFWIIKGFHLALVPFTYMMWNLLIDMKNEWGMVQYQYGAWHVIMLLGVLSLHVTFWTLDKEVRREDVRKKIRKD